MAVDTEENPVLYEDLAALENDFDDAELEILRKQHDLYAPLYDRRASLISRVPHFWGTVLEQCPPELDSWIQPSDSALLADHLTSLTVIRPELDSAPASGKAGSPRSFTVRFDFSPNDTFSDAYLEKKFWFRRASDGWAGLVSEPVRIAWKEGKDLTDGLNAAAAALFEARQRQAKKAGGSGKAKHGAEKELPEYAALVKKVEESDETSLSFFAWFSFVSGHRYVDAEESVEAEAKEREEREKRRKGEKVEEKMEEDGVNGESDDDGHLEIHPAGDDIAVLIADDLWPNAIKYFTSAREADDEPLSDLEVSDVEDSDDDEDGDGKMVDIRALVGKGKRAKGEVQSVSPPPAKKLR